MNYTYDAAAFRADFERSFTWLAGYRRSVRRYGAKTAVIDPLKGQTLTYAELDRAVNRLARVLQSAGTGVGDTVLYQL